LLCAPNRDILGNQSMCNLRENGGADRKAKRKLEMTLVAGCISTTANVKRAFLYMTAAIVVAAVSTFAPAARADGSWCATYGTGGTNCGLHSLSNVKPRFPGQVASAGRIHSTVPRTNRDDIGDITTIRSISLAVSRNLQQEQHWSRE
jgi:hypothetical protein